MADTKDNFDFKAKKNFIVLHINKVCRSHWSDDDNRNGKAIRIKWANREAAFAVLPLYKEKGWIVSKEAVLEKSGRTLIIRIKRPPMPLSNAYRAH